MRLFTSPVPVPATSCETGVAHCRVEAAVPILVHVSLQRVHSAPLWGTVSAEPDRPLRPSRGDQALGSPCAIGQSPAWRLLSRLAAPRPEILGLTHGITPRASFFYTAGVYVGARAGNNQRRFRICGLHAGIPLDPGGRKPASVRRISPSASLSDPTGQRWKYHHKRRQMRQNAAVCENRESR